MTQNRTLRGLCLRIFTCLTLLLSAVLLPAQDQSIVASLNGVITDSSGAIVPGAKVTITGTENGVTRTTASDSSGAYLVRLLPPGTYQLQVDSKGFKVYAQKGIALVPGQNAKQDVQLTVGAETEQVVVDSQAPLLNTSDANLSAEIDAKQVRDLPLNLRNVYGLAILNSSVQNGTESQKVFGGGTQGVADQDISFLNFGGGFFGTTAFMLDGNWDTASDWGAVVYVPSVDSVEQFKIQTNSFTAQSGFSTGNVINVVTKSGTSSFHGDAYEFLRNDKLDANSFFNNFYGNPKPSFRRNQFGIAAGGPLYLPKLYKQREKTFVFGLYEGLRQSTPATFTATVPTEAMRTGDFSAILGASIGTDALGLPIYSGQLYNPYTGRVLHNGSVDSKTGRTVLCPVDSKTGLPAATCNYRDPFADNQIQNAINPVGAALAAFYPRPSNSSLSNNYSASASAPATSNEYLIRVDHNISDLTRIYGRFAKKLEFKTNSPAFYGADNPGGPGNVRPNNRYNIVLGINHAFNAKTGISANAGLSRWGEGSNTQGFPFDQSSVGLPAALNANSPIFPIIQVESQAALGPVQGNQGIGYRNVGSYSIDVTRSERAHDLSAGFINAIIQNNGSNYPSTQFNFDHGFTAGPNPTSTESGTGFGFASLLLGTAGSGNTANNFNPAVQKKYFGFYGQDNWKFNRKVTFNLGLRYEWQGAPTERHDRQAYFDYTATNPISNEVGLSLPGKLVYNTNGRRGIYDTQFNNIAPRIGFTAQILQHLVARGGYGIFFAPQYFGGGYNPGYSQSTPYNASNDGGVTLAATLSNPFPGGLIAPTGRSLESLQDVGQGTNGVPHNRKSPYVQQYSLGLQYAFTTNDVLTLSYVGNHGTRLLISNFNRSQVDPVNYALGDGLNEQVANPFYGAIKVSGCGLNQPTIQRGHLLQPFPQYCNVNEPQAPVGFSLYNALQADYNHRFHGGLNLLVSYTFSKFIDNVSGTNDWSYVGSQGPRNYYNLAAEKSVDGGDTPHSLVINYIYELPVGKKRKFAANINGVTDAVIGGWQVSGISSFKSGIPLGFYGGGNVNLFGGNSRPDLVSNPHISHPTINQWFDYNAFQHPTGYNTGNTARFLSQLRAPGYHNWDMALQKFWTLHEQVRLQGRAEFFNAFNHPNFYAPDTSLGDRQLDENGNNTGSFGTIRQAFPGRSVQFAMKLYW